MLTYFDPALVAVVEKRDRYGLASDAPLDSLSLFGMAELERLARCEPDPFALDMKADAFRDRLNDSPAWAAYFREVGDHFDHGAARTRRHPERVA